MKSRHSIAEKRVRRSKFAFIEFRDSAAGRQPYVQGSSLTVWEVILLLRSYRQDARAVAEHLRWPEAKVRAAFNYATAFPREIQEAITENEAVDFAALKRILPQATEVRLPRPSKR